MCDMCAETMPHVDCARATSKYTDMLQECILYKWNKFNVR